jgi:hypothetical protein
VLCCVGLTLRIYSLGVFWGHELPLYRSGLCGNNLRHSKGNKAKKNNWKVGFHMGIQKGGNLLWVHPIGDSTLPTERQSPPRLMDLVTVKERVDDIM